MELGISPIISSGMVFQLLAGTHLIDVNLDLKSDRELYQTAQKRKIFHSSLARSSNWANKTLRSVCYHPFSRTSYCVCFDWSLRTA